VLARLGRSQTEDARERIQRHLDPRLERRHPVVEVPVIEERVGELLGEQARTRLAPADQGVPPVVVVDVEELHFQDVARFGALDGHRTGEVVADELRLREVPGGRLGGDVRPAVV